ncbi:Aste57867_23845 [Aphanomyces stellatus]|uniref:Aste57867_23845 protein n=1 Tax=Aphanomyces stellatus TaxID=120398 RepID=A0A485LNQ4_9STRA|nr:hypothetical protein As57867_023772 [Aphanomyces stellatus]VFU00488.1 Aste57867_23845 [Aphanomyces stellatus]
MSGVLTVWPYMFDVKLWLVVVDPERGMRSRKNFASCTLDGTSEPEKAVSPKASQQNRAFVVAGLVYMATTILGSVVYLTMTSTNMANDFWWANCQASREHTYLVRMYNGQLLLRQKEGAVSLDNPRFLDSADYNKSNAVNAQLSPLYVTRVKTTDGADLGMVVRGLRRMDACLAPWISTQYCWVDFSKTWEMANSAKRQARCNANYVANGAAYLEGLLRNVNRDQLNSCWGTSLEIAFATPLRQTDKGGQWWDSVQSMARMTEADEVTYWRSFGVTAYLVDWQNYKYVGIVDTFNIQNSFGTTYAMTLKRTNGTFRVAAQTSMKMYWAFASDLWAVTSDTSQMGGKSLIRNTASFAFTTLTMEDVLVQNGTLQPSALTSGTYGTFRQVIGPFGSVDIKHVVAPPSLMALALKVKDDIASMSIKSNAFSYTFAQLSTSIMSLLTRAVPAPWQNAGYAIGGNILCDQVATALFSGGMSCFGGIESACGSLANENFVPMYYSLLVASLGADIVKPDLNPNVSRSICAQFTAQQGKCQPDLIKNPTAFMLNTTLFPDPTVVANWKAMVTAAQEDIRLLNVSIMQYASATVSYTNISLLRQAIFDTALPDFHYVGWIMAWEWAVSAREVLSFQGDVDSIAVLTRQMFDVSTPANALEIPLNVANYIRLACYYVTCNIIGVSLLAVAYTAINKGQVEGLNLFELNRVAGIVWVGRTLLFIRGIAAICLLSTQVLTLEPLNYVYHFVTTATAASEPAADKAIRYIKIFLAASEVSWLSFVLNDFFMIATQQYTAAYVFKCNILVWLLSAVLSFASPVTHTASIDRSCEYSDVDFQLVCSNGMIAIGSFVRFMTLVAICVGSALVCYIYERVRRPSLPLPHQNSLFLAASAKLVFEAQHWVAHEVYYLDQSSAAINGLLSVRLGSSFYMFDLKTWRTFVINAPAEKLKQLARESHLLTAIPLTD